MITLLDWSIAHGIELGCGMLALALMMIGWLLIDAVRGRVDDGFEPIGRPTTDVPRRQYTPFEREGLENRVTRTLVQPPLT